MANKRNIFLLIFLVMLSLIFASCGNKEEQNLSVTNPYLADWPPDVPLPPATQFTGITKLEGNNNYNFQATGKPMRIYEVYKSLIEKNGFLERSNTMNENGGQVIWEKGMNRRVIFSVYVDKQVCVITIVRN